MFEKHSQHLPKQTTLLETNSSLDKHLLLQAPTVLQKKKGAQQAILTLFLALSLVETPACQSSSACISLLNDAQPHSAYTF